jgi:hypothetical protein
MATLGHGQQGIYKSQANCVHTMGSPFYLNIPEAQYGKGYPAVVAQLNAINFTFDLYQTQGHKRALLPSLNLVFFIF